MNKLEFPEIELLSPGLSSCPGCGSTIAMRHILKILGEKTVILIPASCWTIIPGIFPHSALRVPVMFTTFETAAPDASGIKAVFEVRGEKVNVVSWAGDGATFDIGFAALSAAAERDEDIIYVCNDNEAYMNTGAQRSSATPWGAWTTTTPVNAPKQEQKKDIMAIMAAHRIPYAATACIGSISLLRDFYQKLQKAKEIQGFRFIHLLSPCVPGWGYSSELTVEITRLAVETRYFPLYEIENGEKYTLREVKKYIPVKEFLKLQRRFRHLTEEDMARIQKEVDKNWERLQRLTQMQNPTER